jgi:outer membrane translocation and assembly module TamA
VGRFGAAVFADTGAVYEAEAALKDARFDTGLGAGLFVHAPIFSFRADVARGLGSGTRAHIGLGISF